MGLRRVGLSHFDTTDYIVLQHHEKKNDIVLIVRWQRTYIHTCGVSGKIYFLLVPMKCVIQGPVVHISSRCWCPSSSTLPIL
eukprot:COSAG05_NODE_1968_length_3768_cov_11.358408_4_plen_82_part_00